MENLIRMKDARKNQTIDNFVKNYLARTARFKTLHAFEECLSKNRQSKTALSFVIERPPKRKLHDIDLDVQKPNKSKKKEIKGLKLTSGENKLFCSRNSESL